MGRKKRKIGKVERQRREEKKRGRAELGEVAK